MRFEDCKTEQELFNTLEKRLEQEAKGWQANRPSREDYKEEDKEKES